MPEKEPAPVYIYCCEITLWEHVFYSSREVSDFFQTEPLIGNYALAYAFGLARSTYHVAADPEGRQPVFYKRDLAPLNERGVYITPATILGEPRFALSQFNTQPDSYWYAFAQNAVVTKQDSERAEYRDRRWSLTSAEKGQRRVYPANFPQHGRIKMLALGNRAVAYVVSRERLETVAGSYKLPSYIRLGKWMSKAAVTVQQQRSDPIWKDEVVVDRFLNPADLPDPSALRRYDLVSVHPVPLIRNASLGGWFYRAVDGALLPAGMRFGVEQLPDNTAPESGEPPKRRKSKAASSKSRR